MRVYAEDLGTLTHTVQKNGVAGRKIAQDWSCARIARSSLGVVKGVQWRGTDLLIASGSRLLYFELFNSQQ
jgi:hypothetical protein